jgi:hypothetical protein
MPRICACLIFFLLGFALLPSSQALTFTVEAHVEECFYEIIDVNVVLNVQYQVIQGGFLDIDASFFAPQRGLIYEAERDTEGKFSYVTSEAGEYRFCFSNRMSTLTPKKVSLQISLGKTKATKVLETLNPLEDSIMQLSQGIQEVKDGQTYMKNRERATRDTSESTNARVLWWSFWEAFLLVGVCAWQIYSLRRFFEVKRVV